MARTTTRAKLPVPDAVRCSMIDRNGQRCIRQATFRVTKLDESTEKLCRTCAYKLRDQIQAHPKYFDTVRFEALNPASQLER